eukprot:2530873-Rhodomonas_salina.2
MMMLLGPTTGPSSGWNAWSGCTIVSALVAAHLALLLGNEREFTGHAATGPAGRPMTRMSGGVVGRAWDLRFFRHGSWGDGCSARSIGMSE